jgi:hypothetical protein
MDPGIPFADLLAYNADENEHWQPWFADHPAALDLPCDVAGVATVRTPLLHIFATELFFASRVLDHPRPDYEKLPSGMLEELFAISTDARGKFNEFLAKATPEEWGAPHSSGLSRSQSQQEKNGRSSHAAQRPSSCTTGDLPAPARLQARLDARLHPEQGDGVKEGRSQRLTSF